MTAHAAATAPVPHASVSASTPRSYVRSDHSDGELRGETKFTLAPSGPRAGSERSARPRGARSTELTSSTSTTRCGTPTSPRATRRSPSVPARPGTGVGAGTAARRSSARSPGPARRLSQRPASVPGPLGPVHEHDGDFLQDEPFAPCPHTHFDLKRVPVGPYLSQVNRLEHLPAKTLEAACQVPHSQAGQPTGVNIGTVG